MPSDLKQWRNDKGLTQAEAAKILRVTQATISRIESGEMAVSTPRALRIFKATGVKLGPLEKANTKEIATITRLYEVAA